MPNLWNASGVTQLSNLRIRYASVSYVKLISISGPEREQGTFTSTYLRKESQVPKHCVSLTKIR